MISHIQPHKIPQSYTIIISDLTCLHSPPWNLDYHGLSFPFVAAMAQTGGATCIVPTGLDDVESGGVASLKSWSEPSGSCERKIPWRNDGKLTFSKLWIFQTAIPSSHPIHNICFLGHIPKVFLTRKPSETSRKPSWRLVFLGGFDPSTPRLEHRSRPRPRNVCRSPTPPRICGNLRKATGRQRSEFVKQELRTQRL